MSADDTRKRAFSRTERAALARLAALPEEAIDTADIPEAPAENWAMARRGGLYRPVKQPVTIRLDKDVVAWFRARGEHYQTEINRVLRRHMLEHS